MFKDYFTPLFNYDRYANLQFTTLINATNNSERPAELMAHLLNAQQIWLSRCRGTSSSNYQLWPKWEPKSFNDIIENNYREWIDFLNIETDLAKTVVYENFKGEKFTSKLVDILTHVINHGTHHRAQIGMLLKQNEGVALPSTDYVHYVRGSQ